MKMIIYACALLLQFYGIRADCKDNTKLLKDKFAVFEAEFKKIKSILRKIKKTNEGCNSNDDPQSGDVLNKLDGLSSLVNESCNGGHQSGDVLNKLDGLSSLVNESCNGDSPRASTTIARCPTTPAISGEMCVCPEHEGFIHLPGTTQCYKALPDQERSWVDAGEQCRSKGLELAEPVNPIQIRKHLNGIYENSAFWIGGRGTGSSVQYQRGGGQLHRGDSLWIPGHPEGQGYTPAQCLVMSALSSHLRSYPSAPYFSYACSDTSLAYALCEVVFR